MFKIQSEDHSRLYADVQIIKDVSHARVQESSMRKELLYKYIISISILPLVLGHIYFGPYLVRFSSKTSVF